MISFLSILLKNKWKIDIIKPWLNFLRLRTAWHLSEAEENSKDKIFLP